MRISDWSSDVCSSDLLNLSQNSGQSPIPVRQSRHQRMMPTAHRAKRRGRKKALVAAGGSALSALDELKWGEAVVGLSPLSFSVLMRRFDCSTAQVLPSLSSGGELTTFGPARP